jgi:hypothetical protein
MDAAEKFFFSLTLCKTRREDRKTMAVREKEEQKKNGPT